MESVISSSRITRPDNAARFPQAVELFRRAAALGNADAAYNLGVCLRRGLGVRPDTQAAERSYRAAAERNHVSAQLALGDVISESATTDAGWLEAAQWYGRAADSGNAPAKARLAEIQESRLCPETNDTAAGQG